ncbi:17.8 kDa class I heat shock protein-like [Cornus florida]|uniref:17.8 kDa class I heat shock protein-like n=1 Tax=Cornus florida TaxID=4283 RepID=UPI00289A5214|nr:17.8 kDa class I heat shock protein-like [Cornus florida]
MSFIPNSFFGNRCSNSTFDPFSLDLWDLFRTSHFSAPSLSVPMNKTTMFANTQIDWKETPEAHVFKADLPGLKEEVKVEVEEGKVLQISGERSNDKKEKDDKWHRVECSTGNLLTNIFKNF